MNVHVHTTIDALVHHRMVLVASDDVYHMADDLWAFAWNVDDVLPIHVHRTIDDSLDRTHQYYYC